MCGPTPSALCRRWAKLPREDSGLFCLWLLLPERVGNRAFDRGGAVARRDRLNVGRRLALLQRLRKTSRPDLSLGVMSATLDAAPVAGYLGDADEVRSEGRQFEVGIDYLDRPSQKPLPEQIAEACNLDVNEVVDLLGVIEQPVSLDAPVDDEARYSLADTLEDSGALAPAETASQHLLGEELHRALALLTPRERSVITLRYGIGDGRSRTLLEVGKELGISRERVRQLEVVALMKLRTISSKAALKECV